MFLGTVRQNKAWAENCRNHPPQPDPCRGLLMKGESAVQLNLNWQEGAAKSFGPFVFYVHSRDFLWRGAMHKTCIALSTRGTLVCKSNLHLPSSDLQQTTRGEGVKSGQERPAALCPGVGTVSRAGSSPAKWLSTTCQLTRNDCSSGLCATFESAIRKFQWEENTM